MKTMKTSSISFNLTKKSYDLIKKFAKKEDMSVSELARQAIDKFLSTKKVIKK